MFYERDTTDQILWHGSPPWAGCGRAELLLEAHGFYYVFTCHVEPGGGRRCAQPAVKDATRLPLIT